MRSFHAAASAWANEVLLIAICAPLALADVKFTEPSAGTNLTAGQIDVRWEDSGISPPISELTQYTLSLMVGGNDDGDMVRPPRLSQKPEPGSKLTRLISNPYQRLNHKARSRPVIPRKQPFRTALPLKCRTACKLQPLCKFNHFTDHIQASFE